MAEEDEATNKDVQLEEQREEERAKRKAMIDQELNMLVKDAEAEELSEPMEPEAIAALKQAAMKICFVKKYYDVFKDEFIYFPSVTASILDHTLTEEADKYYFDEDDELPMMYGIGLRSVAGIAASKEEHTIDIDYLLPLSMDVDIGEEEEEVAAVPAPVISEEELPTPTPTESLIVSATEEEAETPATGEVEATEPVDDTEDVNTVEEVSDADDKRVERAKRKAMVDQELNMLVKDAETEELSEPMEPEAITALKQAAMKICFVKKYYDVFKDDFVYFPSVTASILDHTLTEEADKYYFDEDDELPMMYGIGLRSVAGIAASKEEDTIDIDYLLPLSMDVDIGEEEEEGEDQAIVVPISVEEKAPILAVKESTSPTLTAPEPEPTIPNDNYIAEEVAFADMEEFVAPDEPTIVEEHSPTIAVDESTAPSERVNEEDKVVSERDTPVLDENKAPQGTSRERGMEAPAESPAFSTRNVLDTKKEAPKSVVTVEEVTSDTESVAGAENESKPREPPIDAERHTNPGSNSSSSLLVAFVVGCSVAWLLNRWQS
jgi:hypothetical protein